MRDILGQIKAWHVAGQSVALATVIRTWGSSPRPSGAGMAVCLDGRITGSVSGGCVEGAVIQEAQSVIKTQQPKRLHFGVADDDAWEVGLACGGEIEVYIRPFTADDLNNWERMLGKNIPFCAILDIQEGTDVAGTEFFLSEDGWLIGSGVLPSTWQDMETVALGILSSGKTTILEDQGVDVGELFMNVVLPPPRLIVVGGGHLSIPLVDQARILGFDVIVIDPRRLFSTKERFPWVTLIQEWPSTAFGKIEVSRSSAIVMLTHDPKIDDPALIAALDSPCFYIGALGSKKTHKKRLERLRSAGVDEFKLERIHAPIGLDLGGRTPPEIAISIIAEIVQVWNNTK